MASKRAIEVNTLDQLAEGFQESRGIADKLSLEQMIELAKEKVSGGEDKFNQLMNKTITEVTAEDLEGVTDIPLCAFMDCSLLESVTFPDSIRKILSQAFKLCTSLTRIILHDNITLIDANAFEWCQGLIDVIFGSGLTQIGSYAFRNCTSIENIIIPDSVTSIGTYTFNGCTSLVSVILGKGIKEAKGYAFQNCTSLTSITFGDETTRISSSCLSGCTSLTNVTIPATIKYVESGALQIGSSTNKATITFLGNTPPSISSNIFNADYLEKIIVPIGCGDAYKSATNWANFADYIEEATE